MGIEMYEVSDSKKKKICNLHVDVCSQFRHVRVYIVCCWT